MADVGVEMKVFVDDPANLEEVKTSLNQALPRVQKIEEEDLAFGIKALKVIFIVEDGAGINELEDKVNGLEHVTQSEIVVTSRLG